MDRFFVQTRLERIKPCFSERIPCFCERDVAKGKIIPDNVSKGLRITMVGTTFHRDLGYKIDDRVCTKADLLSLISLFLPPYRVCTKVRRVQTKDYRESTKLQLFSCILLPCLHESGTVGAQKALVTARKLLREWTKVYRVYTQKPPCLCINVNSIFTNIWENSAEFSKRMLVSILSIIKKIPTTTNRIPINHLPWLHESVGEY